MNAQLKDGWLTVGFPEGVDDTPVSYIGISDTRDAPTQWLPAFLDYDDGRRVAKVRPPQGMTSRSLVWSSIGGEEKAIGRVAMS